MKPLGDVKVMKVTVVAVRVRGPVTRHGQVTDEAHTDGILRPNNLPRRSSAGDEVEAFDPKRYGTVSYEEGSSVLPVPCDIRQGQVPERAVHPTWRSARFDEPQAPHRVALTSRSPECIALR